MMGAKYISDHTRFIAELKRQNPRMEEGQRKGRALLWDKRVDLDEQRRQQAAEVPQPAYPYQNFVGPLPGTQATDTVTPGTPADNKN
jgi:hypothetical protein